MRFSRGPAARYRPSAHAVANLKIAVGHWMPVFRYILPKPIDM